MTPFSPHRLFRPWLRTPHRKFLRTVCIVWLPLVILQAAYAYGGTRRHMVLYGGIPDGMVEDIARSADLLVLGTIRGDQLDQLKRINPEIVLLKYHHGLSIPQTSPDWAIVDSRENWFAHDRTSGRRMTAGTYGWTLMNIADSSWRNYHAAMIATTTEERFDGVFIDDFWDRFVAKFVAEGTDRPAAPEPFIVDRWPSLMTDVLRMLRENYSKLIFINGAHEAYISHVDGCMEESFVHSSHNPDEWLRPAVGAYRSILEMEQLKKQGKVLLIQSGTRGNTGGDPQALFRLCHRAYLLIADRNTYFNFHPASSYNWRNLHVSDDYRIDLGPAAGAFEVVPPGASSASLLNNGDFASGLGAWKIIGGKPRIEVSTSAHRHSVLFQGDGLSGDRILSEFIPVTPGISYALSAWCKTEQNTPGSAGYKKLGIQGRFFDGEGARLPGAFDLQFDGGSYGWLPFEATFVSPPSAAFFQIRIGFIGDGRGRGWVTGVSFAATAARSLILKRDFQRGSVYVNLGNQAEQIRPVRERSAITLGARDAVIRYSR